MTFKEKRDNYEKTSYELKSLALLSAFLVFLFNIIFLIILMFERKDWLLSVTIIATLIPPILFALSLLYQKLSKRITENVLDGKISHEDYYGKKEKD